jgi:MFS family permease
VRMIVSPSRSPVSSSSSPHCGQATSGNGGPFGQWRTDDPDRTLAASCGPVCVALSISPLPDAPRDADGFSRKRWRHHVTSFRASTRPGAGADPAPGEGGTPGPARRAGFSGWRIVVLATITLGMTGPGQTAGVSVFVDPMIAGLDLSRSQVATAYLVGTLTAALAMPRVGRLLDLRGTRFAMTAVGGAFGVVLAAMAGVQGLVTLAVGFIGIRMLGQGGLTLIATTSVSYWFKERRGLAVGLVTAFGAGILALTPVVMASVIGAVGWRASWLIAAGVVLAVVLPIARLGMIDRPSDVGQQVDGVSDHAAAAAGPAIGLTRRQAASTGMFWALVGGVTTTGLVGTGMTFHQIDLLGQQGLTPLQAAANFLPQTLAAASATLATGALVDRLSVRVLLCASMATLAASMVALPWVGPDLSVVAYAAGIGASGGMARALEGAGMPKMFGVRHVGAIRGLAMGLMVASTAFGPLALSLGRDLTGGYVSVLRLLLVLPVAVVVLGLLSRVPSVPEPREA